ncbi:MAG: SecDF P1 head subdomain-containing protein, partial [Flavobacteriales bacterium]
LYTYQECKSREINLGLDLKGGMSVTLEVSVKDILVSLSGYNKEELKKDKLSKEALQFKEALQNAVKNMANSPGKTLVELFANEFEPEGTELAAIFGTRTLREKVRGKNNTEVIKVINSEVTDAIESSFDILRSRIDRFGVTQPNLQKTNIPGRIIVELPGIKDPDRAKKLLQSSAQLEFWETFEFSEIIEDMQSANDYLSVIKGFEKDTTSESDTSTSDQTAEEFAQENPLFSVLQPNIKLNENGQQVIPSGPVVGYTLLKDTSTLNSYINDDEFMSNFDSDVKFSLAFAPDDETKETFVVIALKRKGNNGYIMDGSVISDAQQVLDNGKVIVSMSMNADGANIWRDATGRAAAEKAPDGRGKSIAIVLDGYVKS